MCPVSYIKAWGSNNDHGTTLGSGYMASLEKCKEGCDALPECKGFHYSHNSGYQCKLKSVSTPSAPDNKESPFCIKDEGTILGYIQ